MLDGDLVPDACVIGAGIAGLTAAYLLAREGHGVVVLEARGLGAGVCSDGSAPLTCVPDGGLARFAQRHGESAARLFVNSHLAAIRRIGTIVREEGIDCGHAEAPGYFAPSPGGDAALLRAELEAARAAVVPGVTMLAEIPDAAFDSGPCLMFPRQALVHPLRYLNGLADAVVRAGGQVYCRTPVTRIDESGGERIAVETDRGVVRARHVVVATSELDHPRLAAHVKQSAQETHAIAMGLRHGALPAMLAWDDGDPQHHVRTMHDLRLAGTSSSARELLLVGGGESRVGEDSALAARHDELEAWARERFGDLVEDVEFAWSGQSRRPLDRLAFMGRLAGRQNLHVILGDSRQDMTQGTAGGMLVGDLVAGRANPWHRLYDPSRLTVRAGRVLAQHALSTLRCWAEWTGGVLGTTARGELRNVQ